MQTQLVSSGATAQHNEDWAGSFPRHDGAELVMIDGGTSMAERDYVDPVNGDVVWFVHRFATALKARIEADLDQQTAVHAAIDAVFDEFRARSAGQDVPVYAWPIAALTWVRARQVGNGFRLELYCLGDCKALMRTPDGVVHDLDPFVNPQEAILRAEIAKLQAEGLSDPAARQARLLPMLRARREFQNTVAGTNSLCLRPNGPLGARTYAVDAPPGSCVLAMTDGFYRLVDTYGLHTPESLFTLCREAGVHAALEQLRQFEAVQAASAQTLKRADDASAILWCADGVQD
ncbi:protein phosphatase 2C domain-containing protein [Massilia sp. IC2-476]|uniref:protein phosphatase 2C domain-containing protein n=1 Tax=Massilia sp. IC2-476 TaxID=2887199 RepID=UPI001D126341|nr:protein phosphatase 2C domain-containing protein [Massilia sp. IC2-476]MCC2974365.1 protein phosphatase 2C domain-containing protein [Massilia sp. IC2-476]